jgi:subtilisin family serine protease
MPLLGLDCYVMAVPDGQSVERVAERIARDPGVAWSEPLHEFRAQAEPATHDDPLFRAQPAARLWRLADLHRFATGRNVRVAVVDSLVDNNHPDLVGQIAVQEDFAADHGRRPELHGTGVAGVIAAKADNGIGIAGVAPQARLMALRACWQVDRGAAGPMTVCDSLSLAKALHSAVERGAQVINLSLSGPPDRLIASLLDTALSRGVTVVAAYDRMLPRGGFPASHPGVIAVADESVVDLPKGVYIAPGRDVPTTGPGGRWLLVNGSSYAAAHVSGLVALVRERHARTGGRFELVSARPDGGAVDACASVLKPPRRCDCACTFAGAPKLGQ